MIHQGAQVVFAAAFLAQLDDLLELAEVAEAMKQIQTDNDKLAARVRALLARVPKDLREEGFTAIFNGKDLTGWDGKPGWWTVEDGALTAESTTEKPCKRANYLIWRGGQPGGEVFALREGRVANRGEGPRVVVIAKVRELLGHADHALLRPRLIRRGRAVQSPLHPDGEQVLLQEAP